MKFAIDTRQDWLRINLLIAFMATFIISCVQATNVYAVSDYDNVIQMGGSVGLYLPVNSDGMGRCSQPYLNSPKSNDLTTSLGGILLNPANYTNSTVGADGSAFWQDLLDNPDDYAWSVSQYTNPDGYKFVQIVASTTRGAQFETVGGYKALRTTGTNTRFFGIDYYSYGNPNIRCDVHVNYNNNYGKAYIAVDANASVEKFAYINYDITYPQDYEGVVPSAGSEDADEDGLTLAQETAQGTSDSQLDTDHDGLSDYVESSLNPDRDAEFCNATSTPMSCAYPDPSKQDVYVEIDWMYDPVNNRSFKPSDTQLGLITAAFSAHGINFHADTGQFGGGNQLPTYTETLHIDDTPPYVGFSHYKYGYDSYPANFSSDRESIWRYMISGYNFAEGPDLSGIADVSGSDIFVSYGLVQDGSFSNMDDALAGTMIHEIGHTLCLSSSQVYYEQPSECYYAGVDSDNVAYALYGSAMTYVHQFDTVNYSDGTNGAFDHDDWNAIKLGMGKFNGTKTSLGGVSKIPTNNKLALSAEHSAVHEMSMEQAHQIYDKNQPAERSESTGDVKAAENVKPSAEDTESKGSDAQNKPKTDDALVTSVEGVAATLLALGGAILAIRRNK